MKIKPYYEESGITIYLGDCETILKSLLKSNPKIILITDPPYGLQTLAGSYGRHGATIQNDMDTSTRDCILTLCAEFPTIVFATPRLPEPPGNWDYRLVWDKGSPGLAGGVWRVSHELIFVRGPGWVRTNNSSFTILRFTNSSLQLGRNEHIHRKPVGLLKELISHAPQGVITDPFMGSGTTLVASKQLGRRAIGIEIEEKYCAVAADRLRRTSRSLLVEPKKYKPKSLL